ncbi:602_t:CDS:2 [Diversispora eburnea]|uniref:602_t:CDS:1 n=1 Tax=Diversispora eburnea TaxID=1213867 RepID=A0A9N9C067_9GLOM|nr:602_t:CDS:2 [Diversispora eburnea]
MFISKIINFLKPNQIIEEDVKYKQLAGIAVKENMSLELDINSYSEEDDMDFDEVIDSETRMIKENYSDIMFDFNDINESIEEEESKFNNKNYELDDDTSISEYQKPYQDEQNDTIFEKNIIPKEENDKEDKGEDKQQHKCYESDSVVSSQIITVTSLPLEIEEIAKIHDTHNNEMNDVEEFTPIFKERNLDPDSLKQQPSSTFNQKVSSLIRTIEYSLEPEEEVKDLLNKYDRESDYELSDDEKVTKNNQYIQNDDEIFELACNFEDFEDNINDKEVLYDINDEQINLEEKEKELNINIKPDNLYVDSSKQTVIEINNMILQLYLECKDINENHSEFSFAESILKGSIPS